MSVLKRPLVTEKMTALNEEMKFGFIVDIRANKIEIKKAVEKLYGVTVDEVKTMTYKGKPKARYTKSRIISGTTQKYKKAIVKLSADSDFIDFYSGI